MILDVALTWKDLPSRDLSRSVVVVADVLRATTVMIRALANGARTIRPQESDREARGLYTVLMEQGLPVLLSGEKEGFKREGYDLGNSPFEFKPEIVNDKIIIHLTTNGTRALVSASKAKQVLIASFHNITAVANALRDLDRSIESVVFVVSGKMGEYCLEDTVCLGGIIERLLDPPGRDYTITDSTRTAVDLFQFYQESLPAMIQQCSHGRHLQNIGLGDDLPECVKTDTTDIAPHMKNGNITYSR